MCFTHENSLRFCMLLTFTIRMHSSRMRTAHSGPYGLSSWPGPPSPLVHRPPGQRPPGQGPPGRDPLDRDPPEQKAPPPCGQTNTCENLTFAKFLSGRQKGKSPYNRDIRLCIIYVLLRRGVCGDQATCSQQTPGTYETREQDVYIRTSW